MAAILEKGVFGTISVKGTLGKIACVVTQLKLHLFSNGQPG